MVIKMILLEDKKQKAIAEGVEFVSEEDFKNKVATLISSYFPKHVVNEQVTPEVSGEQSSEEVSPVMAAYLQAISRWSN